MNPNSTSYDFMQEPLLAGEVWIAWDHIARAEGRAAASAERLRRRPAAGRAEGPRLHAGDRRPRDRQGRARPRGRRGAHRASLTKPETQIATAAEVGFFPVVKADAAGRPRRRA